MGFVIICFTQNIVKKGHVPEKLCSSLMLDGAVGIKKMNAEQGKMSSLPNLPVQVCHLFVFRRRKISKNQMLYIFIIATPVGLCGTAMAKQMGNICVFWACRCLKGEWQTGKISCAQNLLWIKQRIACKIEVFKVFTTSSSFKGGF